LKVIFTGRKRDAYDVRSFEVKQFVNTPANVTATSGGTTGSTTRAYKVVGLDADGNHTAGSTAGTSTDGNATLSSVDKQTIDWDADAEAVGGFDIYRTTAGGTPNTTGKIGHVDADVNTFDDTGATGDATSAPTTNTTGYGAGTYVGDLASMSFAVYGTFVGGLDFEGSVDGTNYKKIGSTVTGPDSTSVSDTINYARCRMSSYTSGTPYMAVLGSRDTDV
jgi:hypothetical protein